MKSKLQFTLACSAVLCLCLADGMPVAAISFSPTPFQAAQQKEVTGTVRDASGAPLPGVTVQFKGTNKGTKTDVNGTYRIHADDGAVLVFSYVGHASKEVTVGSGNTSSVVLVENIKGLNELVVTALGIRREVRSTGYAVSRVKGQDLTQAREISVGNALEGRIPGVNSTPPTTGPGGSSRVTIRGNASLAQSSQPLYVIDGMPMNNDNLGSAGKYGGQDQGDGLTSINPDDIQDITVLKGGAAAALYGQRALNGVILITTKTGRAGRLSVELNSNFTIEKLNNFLDFQEEYGQGLKGAKPTDTQSALNSGLSSWGSRLDGSSVTLFDGKQHPYSKQGNHLKDFYETGNTLTNTVSVSGGSEKMTFRASLGDLRSKGIYPNTRYIRNNVTLSLDYKLSDKWSGQTNVTYVKEVTNNRSGVSDAPGNGNYAIAFLPANVAASYLAPGYDEQMNELVYSSDLFSTNPFFAANRFRNNTKKDRVMGVTSIRFTPVEWLYIQARLANDYYGYNATSITPTGTSYRPKGSLDLERNRQFNEMNADVLIGFNKNISSNFVLSANVGANLLQSREKNNDVTASEFAFPFVYDPSTATTKNSIIYDKPKEVHSVYGSVELAYRNALYLTITDRNDWSSTLPVQNNSYNYPSASISYMFSETLKARWLNFGKLRAGISQVGKDADPFSTKLYYSTLGSTINGVPLGNIDNKIPNKDLKPLQATEIEVGTELKMLNNRLFLDFSWYNKKTKNDIVEATTSLGSGYTTAFVNIGEITNKGIELLVGGTPVQTPNFSWTTSVNLANNVNKVVQLAEGQTSMSMLNNESRTEAAFVNHIVGLPYAQVMVYDFKRDEQGRLIVDASGLPQRTDALVPRGTGVAPLTGGWINDLSYKNLHLSFMIDFKYGGHIHSGTNANAYGYGLHKETLPGREGGVTVTGVDDTGKEVSTNIDAQTYYQRLAGISALHVYKTDFIKFRQVSLTYNFNRGMLGNRLQGISLSLVARNLFYFRKETPNIDPESNYSNSNAQGLEYAGLPTTKSFGLNLNVKF